MLFHVEEQCVFILLKSFLSEYYVSRKGFIQTFIKIQETFLLYYNNAWSCWIRHFQYLIIFQLFSPEDLRAREVVWSVKCSCRHLIIYVEPGKSNMHLVWFVGMWEQGWKKRCGTVALLPKENRQKHPCQKDFYQVYHTFRVFLINCSSIEDKTWLGLLCQTPLWPKVSVY